MISCLLIHVSRNPQGLPVCKDSLISGATIEIGRGAACKIHLLDHRVSQLHAAIVRSENGALFINGEKNVTLKINGYIAQHAALAPGTQIEIGPYLLIVEPAAGGYDLILSIELIHPINHTDAAKPDTPLTVAALGLSKRKFGFSLAAGILFLFLFLPMLPNFSGALDKWQVSLPLTLTGAWNPEPLSGGHRMLDAKCSSCHQKPFTAISDDICTGCHKQVGRHLTKEALQDKTFHTMRCTNCHIDHKGAEQLLLHDSSKCVSCHAEIKHTLADSQLGNVSDFAAGHPPFRLSLFKGDGLIRLRQDDKAGLTEQSGLKYSHQVHLAKEGISTPEGDTVMRCQDCHKLEESGRHFSAMTMKNTCQQSGCHALDFTEPVEGLAPHGSEHAVMDRLREFYINWLARAPENQSACQNNADAPSMLACANELADKNAAATLFRTRPVSKKDRLECGECHEIKPSGEKEVPWKVTPVRINRDWQPGAVFNHAKHETMKCTDCHDKLNSKLSADIAIPAITKCRECHSGNRPAKGMVTSGCDSCHRFHQPAK